MKFVITGAAGHISKPLTEKLLAQKHEITVISRSEKNIQPLIAKGAKAAIGSVEDVAFLTKAFTGADAVYTMVPPNMSATNWKKWIGQIGKNYADAIKASGVKYVVNLSSIGAHLPEGCGPVTGLHYAEKAINELQDVHIKNLRPAYFYTNLLGNVGMIKNIGLMGANFGGQNLKVVLVNPEDIAEVAFEELSKLNFTGHSIRYIASDETTTDEIASVFGNAIGKPDLKWVVFSDEDALNGMIQAGLPEEVAKNFQEMNICMQSGRMNEDYWKNHPVLSKTKLEDFAKTFAAIYNGEATAALH
ncbi:MAG: NAD(P)H-binding protein [Bacteroidetes bacterium]|nr:NAD(P)H-binding protein [Bacteroidota bacterium]